MSSNENTSVPIIDATLSHDRPNEMASSVDEIISNSFQSFLPNTDNLEQTTTNSISTTPINGIGSSSSSSSTNSITSLGYCHVCNRQIRINLESFTCTQCNGGFIELFDINETNNNDSLPLLDSELLTNNIINPMTRINTDPIQTSRTSFSDATRTHTPLIQLFRRFNNRSTRLSSPIVNTHETLPDLIENPNYINPLASSLDPTHTATTTSTNNNNNRNSFHYRLRRHTNSNTSTTTNNSNSNGSTNNNSTLFASSSSPSSARHHHHHHHHHRHRFHRSPNSRFHFNFLDDDEILNDHGAIIITTVKFSIILFILEFKILKLINII
jgi:hypothetical protein